MSLSRLFRCGLFAAACLPLLAASPLAAQSYTVTSLADSGAGTLREAIDLANGDGVPSSIDFAPGLAGGTIALASPLPSLNEGQTTIDGDLGHDCVPDIALDASGAPSQPTLQIWTAANVVRGLALFGQTASTVINLGVADAHDNVIECNWLGEDLVGNPIGNGYTGMEIHGGAHDNRIGPGNLVAHTATFGIRISEGYTNAYPEFSGVPADLVTVVPVVDLHDDCGDFRLRGSPPFADSGGHAFSENIGVRLTGTLNVATAGTYSFALDLGLGDGDAVRLTVAGDTLIDWDQAGSPPPADLTLSAGAHAFRLEYREAGGQATLLLDVSGPAATTLSTTGNSGGCVSAQAGLCAQLYQLRVPVERIRVTQNAIYGNGNEGLALGCCCGHDVNDAGDVDLGANTHLNHPELVSVAPAGGGLYTVSGTAPSGAAVEIFRADDDASGYGEGAAYRGSLASDGSGVFSGPVALAPGDNRLTATATDATGNTSEFGLDFALDGGPDTATVSATVSAHPGATIEIPVYARDVSLTPLGVDRPPGERIQSLAYKVTFSPASSIASKTFARAGITASLTPLFQVTPTTASTASYLGQFDEITDPIPFALDAAAPGDQVLKIVVTLANDAPPGPITLTLDPATTEFANQGGTTAENPGNGWLTLVHGQITVLSNAAQALRSYALSSAAIQLDWNDPNANETGFRLERSTDGASWAPVATLGANDISYLDGSGLSPATLYYYRLVTLTPADGYISNVTAASTFPASAAKVCPQELAAPARSYAFTPAVEWNGSEWGVAWYGREGAIQDEIYFQRFHAATLAPLGPPTQVSASASGADRVRTDRPVLAWSDADGGHWGIVWTEGLTGEPGTPLANTTFFALLAPDGSLERSGVRISNATNDHSWEDGLPAPLLWDGTTWGIFELSYVSTPMLDLVYRRLDADGDVVLGPVTVLAPADSHVADISAAWNPATSKYGLAWTEIRDTDIDVYFQVMEESTGALEGSATHLDDYVGVVGTYGFSIVADGTGWAVAWTDVVNDPELGDIGVSWLRRFDATGAPLGPAIRLSDDPPTDSGVPLLARKPGGGFAAFVYCWDLSAPEVCRLETDDAGNRIGGLTQLTPTDGERSDLHDVAGNGNDFLVAFGERGTGTYELAGSLVPVADFSTPGPVEPLTSGHGLVTGGVGNSTVVPLGAGFAAVWLDATSGSNLVQARTWDGAGATLATLSPLDPTPALGRPGVVSVGDTFAVAWRDTSTGDLWFARYDAGGSPVVGRTSVSTFGGFRGGVAMAFSGESYGLLWGRNGANGLAFLRVAPDGTPQGSEVVLPIGNPGNTLPQIQWTGHGWALAWLEPGNLLQYALLAHDGTPIVAEASVATTSQMDIAMQFQLFWNGIDLYLAWSALAVYDPPLDEIFLVRLNLDGSVAYPPVTAPSTPLRDLLPWLYWTHGDARLHLLYQPGGLAGEREIELQSDGTPLPGERWWTNRSLGGIAWNGTTLGYVFGVDGNIYFQTGECVTADVTPPPCPTLSVASFDNLVRLDWDPVTDPESGVFRYHVYRDGLPLAKTWSTTTLFDDGGFGIGFTHDYQVRALSGAWNESDACPAVSFSTTAGDANGDGSYDTADIFYLINFFFADGPPPLGNADANGDNSVTVTDIFYMINNIFSGGPPPLPITGGGNELAAPVETASFGGAEVEAAAAPAPPVRSRLVLGSTTAAPGSTVRIPIDLIDRPGTPLGPERPFGDRVQALALAVACSPCDGIATLTLEPAGPLARFEPRFESRPTRPGHAALVTAYDELDAPLFNGLASSKLRTRVATLVVQLAPNAPLGARLDLRLDPGTTMLSNQAGTTYESVPNGWLELTDGRLTVGAKPDLRRP